MTSPRRCTHQRSNNLLGKGSNGSHYEINKNDMNLTELSRIDRRLSSTKLVVARADVSCARQQSNWFCRRNISSLTQPPPEPSQHTVRANAMGRHAKSRRQKNTPMLTGLVSVFSEDGLETEALYSTAAAASTPGHMAANWESETTAFTSNSIP